MRVVLFEMLSTGYALKLESVERILAPQASLPEGRRAIHLSELLGLPESPVGHTALLAGSDVALALGRPLGTAAVDPAWILPLPGYIFRVGKAPFRGLIDFPEARRGGLARAGVPAGSALLLDEERLEWPASD